jgi:hypothetical protein
MLSWRITLLLALCCPSAFPQAGAPAPSAPLLPETSYVSAQAYTNAYFGFTIPLPPHRPFQLVDLSASQKPFQHFLFGVEYSHKGLTTLLISANQASGNVYDEAKRAAAAGHKKDLGGMSIGGKLFWKVESEEKTVAGKMHSLHYTAPLGGYILDLLLVSYDQKVTDELRRSIESLRFFDPARVQEVAGPNCRAYLPATARVRLASSQNRIAALDPGLTSGSVYTNPYLGFTYRIPADWSTADQRTQQQVQEAGHRLVFGSDSHAESQHRAAERCNRMLLFATKYPESNAEQNYDFNPLIAIVAADPNCFATPVKFPTSIHDEETIQSLGRAVFESFHGTLFMANGVTKLRALDVGGHVFIEIPTTGAVPLPDSKLRRKVYMSTVITSLKDYWVFWMFESDSPSGLEQLKQTPIRFVPGASTGN